MNKQFRPLNFTLQELVHPDIIKALGEQAWELLDPTALMMLQRIRNIFGPTYVNITPTVKYKDRGLRLPNSKTGATFSMHKYGKAFDCSFAKFSPAIVRQYILNNPDDFPGITAVENVDGWLHFDCRNCDAIKVFNP